MGRPAETAETFSAFLASTGTAPGGPFLRTGDLGFQMDGELFVTGRLKDLVVIRGRNYYPEDIESRRRRTAIRRCYAVAGQPSRSRSHSGAAEPLVVVQEVDRDWIADVDVSEVIDAIRTAVTEQHEIRPHAVVLFEPLRIPTTSSGKIRRSSCRQRFLDGDLDVLARVAARRLDVIPARPHRLPIGHRSAKDAARRRSRPGSSPSCPRSSAFHRAEIDTSLPFAHYGLDSVRAIRLTAALETWLQRELSPTVAYEYPTIDLLSQTASRGRTRRRTPRRNGRHRRW